MSAKPLTNGQVTFVLLCQCLTGTTYRKKGLSWCTASEGSINHGIERNVEQLSSC